MLDISIHGKAKALYIMNLLAYAHKISKFDVQVKWSGGGKEIDKI